MNTEQPTRSDWTRAFCVTAAVFVLYVLQHYFRRFGQPIGNIYFTILFNAIALTGLTMIAASYLMGPMARLWPSRWMKYRDMRKQFGLIGLGLVVLHVVIALAVLTPAYYPKFFAEGGKLSRSGEISILAGATGLIVLLVISIISLPSVAANMTVRGWLMVQRAGLIAVILSVLHFAVFKWRGWLGPNWVNGIPPGTLVVTAFIAFVFLMRLIARIAGRKT